jgi:queuosine precursor transporter
MRLVERHARGKKKEVEQAPRTKERGERLLPVITGLFVGILILSNILAAKIVRIGFLVFDGGTLLFPLSYIFGDVLTEVYGYKASRKVIWTGLVMLILMSLNIWIIGALPSDPSWTLQRSFDDILAQVPRIALASILGYFAGEYSNSVVLSRMKVWTQGRWLWMRTIGSTLVGEFADSLIFVVAAFAGSYPRTTIIAMLVSNYVFKCAVEAAFTPATYAVVRFVKRTERTDVYDAGERYNPLPAGR